MLLRLRLAFLEDCPADPAARPVGMDEERPDSRGIVPRIQQLRSAARLRVASEESSPPAPAAAPDDAAVRLGDEVRPVVDQLGVDAERGAESRLHLRRRVVGPGEAARGFRDQALEGGSVLQRGLPKGEGHEASHRRI